MGTSNPALGDMLAMMGHLDRFLRLGLQRTVQLLREVGVLLIAFAPLDAVIAQVENRDIVVIAGISQFFGFGIGLFVCALIPEWMTGFFPEKWRNP